MTPPISVRVVNVGRWFQYYLRDANERPVYSRSKGYRTDREARAGGRRAVKRILAKEPTQPT